MSDDQTWITGDLHVALVAALPFYVKEPFSTSPRLDVTKLHKAMKLSHEAVYRWLRTGRLTAKNIRNLMSVADSAENRAALTQIGRDQPKAEDFARFVLVA